MIGSGLVRGRRGGDRVALGHLDDIGVLLELAMRHENLGQLDTRHQHQAGDEHTGKKLVQTKFVHAHIIRRRGRSPETVWWPAITPADRSLLLAKLPRPLEAPAVPIAPLPRQISDYVMNCRISSSDTASDHHSGPHGGKQAARKTARRHRRQADDPACLGARDGRRHRACVVATDDQRIADTVRGAGGHAVITRADHPSGSDRTFEALQLIDPDGRHDVILNLQGDLPELDPRIPATLLAAVEASGAELSTLVTLADETEAARPQVVKAVIAWDTPSAAGQRFGQALYFSRAAVPTGPAAKYHHIGVYGWRREALATFVSLPPSPLETTERLEQLRALEAGMRIAVAEIDAAPAGVDTEEDLDATRRRLGH